MKLSLERSPEVQGGEKTDGSTNYSSSVSPAVWRETYWLVASGGGQLWLTSILACIRGNSILYTCSTTPAADCAGYSAAGCAARSSPDKPESLCAWPGATF